jgi:hypothetical protein
MYNIYILDPTRNGSGGCTTSTTWSSSGANSAKRNSLPLVRKEEFCIDKKFLFANKNKGITPFLGLAAIGFAGLILAMLCFIAELFVRAWHHEPATSDCGGDGGQGEGASEEDPPLQFNVGVRLRDAIAAAAGNEDAGNGEKNDRK